jgi:2-hydroxychromene-2-carboxylate isomerase
VVNIEFFYDCSSPWTYLGFDSILKLQEDVGFNIKWKPFLVGGVFNTVNPSVQHGRDYPVPAKATYLHKDLADWARHQELDIKWPMTVFPVNSVKAMRGCFVAEEHNKIVPYSMAVFDTYWGQDQDISQEHVMREICAQVGLDADELLEKIANPVYKDRLKANTQELMDRGGFGTPTIFVNGEDMYFGNDRMELILAAIERAS